MLASPEPSPLIKNFESLKHFLFEAIFQYSTQVFKWIDCTTIYIYINKYLIYVFSLLI